MGKKVLAISLLAITLLIGLTGLLIKGNLDAVVKQKLTQALNKAFDGSHYFSADALKTNIVTGEAIIENIKIKPTQAAEQSSMAEIHADISGIVFSGISWLDYLKSGKASFKNILISKPDVNVKTKRTENKNSENQLDKLLESLKSEVSISNLIVEDGKFLLTGKLKDRQYQAQGENINIKANNLSFLKSQKPYISSDYFNAEVQNSEISFGDSGISMGNLRFSSADSTIQAENIELKNLNTTALSLKGYLPKIEVSGIHKNQNSFISNEMVVTEGGNLEIVLMENSTLQEPMAPVIINNLKVSNTALNAKIPGKEELLEIKATFNLFLNQIGPEINSEKLLTNNGSISLSGFELKAEKGNETLSISEIKGNTHNGKLEIKDLNYQQPYHGPTYPGVNLRIPAVSGDKIEFGKLPLKQLKGDKLSAHSPGLWFTIAGQAESEVTDKSLNSIINNFVSQHFTETNLKEGVAVTKGNLKIDYLTDNKWLKQSFENLDLNISELETGRDKDKLPLNSENFSGKVQSYQLECEAGNFMINTSDIAFSGKEGSFSGSDLRVRQLTSRGAHQPYYFEKNVRSYSSTGIDFNKLTIHNYLSARNVNIEGLELFIEADEGKFSNVCTPALTTKEIFQLIPFDIKIENLKINNSNISYLNIPTGIYKPADLSFKNIQLSVTNVTNSENKASKSEAIIVAELEGLSPFKAKLNINFMEPENEFNYQGWVGSIEGNQFNDWLAYVDTGIRKGRIQQTSFDISITGKKATGLMTMEYENLRLDILSAKTGKKKRIYSFISRIFINKDNKTGKKESARSVRINTDLRPEYSFLYSLWHPLKVGMLETVRNDLYIPGE